MSKSVLFYAYASMLIIGGCLAYFLAPAGAHAGTALIVPGIGALLTFFLASAYLASGGGRTLLSRRVYWALIVVAFVFAVGVGMRLGKVMGDPAKDYLVPIFISLTALSVVVGLVGILTRPKGPIPERVMGQSADHDRDAA